MSAEVRVKLGNTLCRCLDWNFAALNVCQLCCVCGFVSVLIIKVGIIMAGQTDCGLFQRKHTPVETFGGLVN